MYTFHHGRQQELYSRSSGFSEVRNKNQSLNKHNLFKYQGKQSQYDRPTNQYVQKLPQNISFQQHELLIKPKEYVQRKNNVCKQAESHLYVDSSHKYPNNQTQNQNSHQKYLTTLKFNENRLSNTIYLKSNNQQHYRKSNEMVLVEKTQAKLTSDFGENSSVNFQHQINGAKANQINSKHVYYSNSYEKEQESLANQTYSRYIESMIEKYGYSAQQKQQKKLKQTRQNTDRFTESSKRREQSPFQMEYKELFQSNLQFSKQRQIKSYLSQNIRPTKGSHREANEYELGISKQQKRQKIQAVSPDKTQILIQQYCEQNSLLEKENQQLEKSIQAKIQKERLLLHKLNLLMTKLEAFKSTSNQQNPSQQSKLQYDQLSNPYCPNKIDNKSCQMPLFNHLQQLQQPISLQSKSSLSYGKPSSLRNKYMPKPEEEKQNYKNVFKTKANSSLSKINSFQSSPIVKTIKQPNLSYPTFEFSLFKEQNCNIDSTPKNEYHNVDLQVSCFDSKFVPRMSNKEKLIELQKTLEDELKRYFKNQKSSKAIKNQVEQCSGRINNFQRTIDHKNISKIDLNHQNTIEKSKSRQKLNLLSQQINQLRLIVAEQEQNIYLDSKVTTNHHI